MSTATRMVTVQSAEQLEMEVTRYIANGFMLMNRTDKAVTLFKKKEFSFFWLFVGWILCEIPFVIYLIYYSGQKDQMVQIRVVAPSALPSAAPEGARISEDGKWWWEGTKWNPVAQPAPSLDAPTPGARISEDGKWWWDGTTWNPVAQPAPALGGPTPAPAIEAPSQSETTKPPEDADPA